MKRLEELLELGGTRKDITLLIISGLALIVSIFDLIPLPFDAAWIAIILCGVPLILEAIIGLVTAFDIDVYKRQSTSSARGAIDRTVRDSTTMSRAAIERV